MSINSVCDDKSNGWVALDSGSKELEIHLEGRMTKKRKLQRDALFPF